MGRRVTIATGLALLLAGCGSLGPYPQVGQKLDVNVRILAAETWVAAAAAEGDAPGERNEIRILVLGEDADGIPTFSSSALDVPIGAGISSRMMQGVWSERDGTMTLIDQTEYALPNERNVGLNGRHGAQRYDGLNDLHRLSATRTADRLVLGGDAGLEGTYVPMATALGHLGTSTPQDAACAFYVMNLAVMTTQVRIIGFGSPAMLQYRSPEPFQGTLSGRVDVAMGGDIFAPDVDITYTQQADFGGVELGGGLRTHSDSSGNGTTFRTVLFTFQPDGAAAPITGSVLYDLTIKDGYAQGGQYTITIDGGASGTATPQDPPDPSTATCLGLP